MKRLAAMGVALLAGASLLLAAAPVRASSPGLQLNPLKYEDTLTGTAVRSGFIDVANSSDTTVSVQAEVKGFKQADLDGNLAFFSDDPIKEGIKLGLDHFDLGPREAVRVTFSVDPAKLPKGGVYAAVFFRTVPPPQSAATSFVAESANVGTLLLLQNGDAGQHIGRLTQFDLPFWQFGHGLSGRAQYQNTNRSTAPIAFSPSLQTRIFPWGHVTKQLGPYVLPGSTRSLSVARPGSYLGLVPISLTDLDSGQVLTRWTFACTGLYAWGLLVFLMMGLLLGGYRIYKKHRG